MYRAVILTTLFTLAAAQYFYPISDDDGNYIELVRIPRAARNQPSMYPSGPLPPRVGAPGGIPSQPSTQTGMAHQMIGYEPIASGSKRNLSSPPSPMDTVIITDMIYVDLWRIHRSWGAFGWYTDHPVHSYGH
ncbi:hypothetical protein Ocin01_16194 [Orchesella cincta]|uniref:Uncharacterized protein n=1 Tax=Orchesella cincta TaxID=48709 RepID=A0A1D2MBX5_ORCCI|nr:hypothetical protein Ocin01_16194 [Orchesella cincta]